LTFLVNRLFHGKAEGIAMSEVSSSTSASRHRRARRVCEALTFRRRIRRIASVEGGHTQRAYQRTQSSNDGGYTFVEIVITITLLAVVVVPILNAVVTSIEASSRSRSAAQVETLVVNAADRVNRAPKACDYYNYARAAVVSRGWDASSVTKFEQAYYEPALSGPAEIDLAQAGHWVFGSSACRLDEPSELEVQLVRIQISSPDGKVSRTIEVVKSDV
jgi:hypothetical protein